MIGYDLAQHIGDPSYQNATPQYNGNMSWFIYNIYGLTITQTPFNPTSLVGYSFAYDSLNRLKGANFGIYAETISGVWDWRGVNDYDGSYYYDTIGNLDSLVRKNSSGTIMDQFTYHYISGTNKLQYVGDAASSSVSTVDIDNQSSDNYLYNDNGNMIADKQNGIGFIFYDVSNLPVEIVKTDNSQIDYDYDENGQRVYNSYANKYYVNNESGQNEAVVDASDNSKITNNIIGNDNIGQIDRDGSTLTRYYYLKDHLGSIRMTVNTSGSVVGYNDYYPFGMVMDGRSEVSSADDRYKFTGKERDVETYYDYSGARFSDPRLGRWLSVDPMADETPAQSPYSYTLDNPVNLIDPNGAYSYTIDGVPIDQGLGEELAQEYQQETALQNQGNDERNQNSENQNLQQQGNENLDKNKKGKAKEKLLNASLGGSFAIGGGLNGAIGYVVDLNGKGYYYFKWGTSNGVSASIGADITISSQSMEESIGSGSTIDPYENSNEVTGNFILPVGPVMVLSSKNSGLKPIGKGISGGYGWRFSGVVNTTWQTFATPVIDIGRLLLGLTVADRPVLIP